MSEPTSPPPAPAVSIGDPGAAFTRVKPLLLPRDQTTGQVVGTDPGPPDTIVDSGRLGELDIRAASVRGLWHRHDGRPRQDDYGLCVDASGEWLVAAVTDGVSEGNLSQKAAHAVAYHGCREVAARLATTHPKDLDWLDLYTRLGALVLRVGRHSLAQVGEPDPDGPTAEDVARLMSTTATFAVRPVRCGPDPVDVVVAWWGDSPVWTLDPDGRWRCLTEVKNADNEIHTSAVAALPHVPDQPGRLPVNHATLDPREVLLLMTDGVGDPLGAAAGEVAAFLAEAWRRPPSTLDFVAQVGFGRKSFDDDRTVVAIWPCEEP